MSMSPIRVLLADDNLIVREGVRALVELEPDLEVVAVATDYEELIAGVDAAVPQVVVTDIRMPPSFQTEGIEAAREVRRRHPGTGVVVLSQYDDPSYILSLVQDGAAGCAYLLKDRLAEAGQLARAIRVVSAGGSVLDAKIVDGLVRDASGGEKLDSENDELIRLIAEGRSIKAIAAARRTTPADAAEEIERLFLVLAKEAGQGGTVALRHLTMLHQAIVQREELGESLSRLLPRAITDKLQLDGSQTGRSEILVATVLISDVRGYCAIAERSDPSVLAAQLSEHRAEMNAAVTVAGGTVMHFMGDAVLAVFGAPVRQRDHADLALTAARDMLVRQAVVNARWRSEGLPVFELGLGVSTGPLAAAFLGSEDRLEYTVVGDSVNLAHRLQEHARPGQTIISEATVAALGSPVPVMRLEPLHIRGRNAPVTTFLVDVDRPGLLAHTAEYMTRNPLAARSAS